MTFEKAIRRKVKLKLALTGPSGSGKTYSALSLAKGIGGKIALIDTENQSASLYSSLVDFDTACIKSPFTPEAYIEAIKEAEKLGYDVMIIDSITHEWNGKGGVLEILENVTKSITKGNSYMAWSHVTPRHNAFIQAILQSNMHIIVTMRSKQDFVLVEKNGKQVPQKVGLAPIQRDGFEYEMTTVFDISIDGHIATASKDRTNLFDKYAEKITEETGEMFNKWLVSGEEEKPQTTTETPDEQLLQKSSAYAKAIAAVTSKEELDKLVSENAVFMSSLYDDNKKWHTELTGRLDQKRKSFEK